MLDEKTTRARLLVRESENVRKMVKDLVLLRHEKIMNLASSGEATPIEGFTEEEEKLVREVAPSFESFQTLFKEIVSGRLSSSTLDKPRKRVLRFLKDTPSLIGSDLKIYGPFQPQDVASVPAENAKILVKQGVAVEVEVTLEQS